MSKLVLDAVTRAKLNGLLQSLELYDEDGNLLAYCTPADPAVDSLPILPGPNAFSDAEIEEAMNDTDSGRPLSEILAAAHP